MNQSAYVYSYAQPEKGKLVFLVFEISDSGLYDPTVHVYQDFANLMGFDPEMTFEPYVYKRDRTNQ